MTRSLVVLALLFASSAMADEVYVPLGGTTEVRIVNSSETSLEVAGTSRRITLEPGEHVRTFESAEPGALRIISAEPVQISAMHRCAPCGSRAMVPLFADAQRDGAIATPERDGWRSGVVLVNPDDRPALVRIDHTTVEIPPRGLRVIDGASLTFTGSRVIAFAFDVNERSGARLVSRVHQASSTPRRRSARFPSDPPVSTPQTVAFIPSKDATLYEANDGSIANGAGVHLFAGNTGGRQKRRALLQFDLASQIPAGSRITRVSLTMTVSITISGGQSMELRRVTREWAEGPSAPAPVRDGIGTSARTGDATWIHAVRATSNWTRAGGDFESAVDATASAGGPGTTPTWSSDAMIARVQGWVDQPSTNFGWIVLGNESASSTAKRFESRESDLTDARPTLTVEFTK